MNLQLVALALLALTAAVGISWPTSSRVSRIAVTAREADSTAMAGGSRFANFEKLARHRLAAVKVWLVRRRTYERRRSAAIEFLGALSAELGVGQPLAIAFERAAASIPVTICPLSRAAARMGGDLADALRQDAERERLPSLRALAALWRVSEESGASLAAAVGRLAQSQLASEEIRGTLQAELAGPKATAKVLAGLPILGLLLGSSLGGDPIGWLTGSIWGVAVLVVGIALESLGIFWVLRMMRAVEQRL